MKYSKQQLSADLEQTVGLMSVRDFDGAETIFLNSIFPGIRLLDDPVTYGRVLEKMVDAFAASGAWGYARTILNTESERKNECVEFERPIRVAYSRLTDRMIGIGELDLAEQLIKEQVLPFFHQRLDMRSIAVTQGKIAEIMVRRGDIASAEQTRRQQIPEFERIGDLVELCHTYYELARLCFIQSRIEDGLELLKEEVLPLAEYNADPRMRALAYGMIADVYTRRGELDEALRIRHEDELPVYEQVGDLRSVAITKGQIADIMSARGELD